MFKTFYLSTVLSVFIFYGCSAKWIPIVWKAEREKVQLTEKQYNLASENNTHVDNPSPECNLSCQKNAECYRDPNSDEEKCQCKKNFAVLYDSLCAECECPENERCSFVDSSPFCSCKDGYIRFEDGCKECQCGQNETCSYIDGSKRCKCLEGYVWGGKSCVECSCGENEECLVLNGEAVCSCMDGYFKINTTTCEDFVSDCRCNENQVCFREDGKFLCRCKKNYAELFTGVCEECICGENEVCSFIGGMPSCECPNGYIQEGEKCEVATVTSTAGATGDATSEVTSTSATEKTSGVSTAAEVTTSHTTTNTGDVTTTAVVTTSSSTTKTAEIITTTVTTSSTTMNTDAITTTKVKTSAVIRTTGAFTASKVTDLCASNPCKFNGSCAQTGANYICECVAPYAGDNCEKVSCDPNPCVRGNCTLIGETEYECRCNESDGTSICKDPHPEGGDSNILSIVTGSVTSAAIVILVLIFSGLKIIRRRKKRDEGYYIQDSETSSERSRECDFRIPNPQEIPNII